MSTFRVYSDEFVLAHHSENITSKYFCDDLSSPGSSCPWTPGSPMVGPQLQDARVTDTIADGGKVQILTPAPTSMHQIVGPLAGKRLSARASHHSLGITLTLLVMFSLGKAALSQNRLPERLSAEQAVVVPDSSSPRVRALIPNGSLSASTILHGVTLNLAMTATQEASLNTLLEAQKQPNSTAYHAWLTPEQFGTQYGLSDADLKSARAWLEEQGLVVESVSRSRRSIRFAGTAGQIEAAFQTKLETFAIDGSTHYANSKEVSLPASLGAVTLGVGNLTSFRPRSHVVIKGTSTHFTSSQSGSHFLTPKDVATIYDVSTAYNAGYTGLGQSITLVGQSSIHNSDIENFQKAAGLTIKDPISVLVPNSGTSTESTGDEAESDLDIEYAGSMAKDASIYFVYVGNNSNYSVFDSLQYAVDNRLTPIISISYGTCETALSNSDYASLNSILQQAAAQGQTVVAASGDSGSTDCYPETTLSTAQRDALAVDFPASSQYVTGMGGTEFASTDVASINTTYWTSASGSDVIGSAKSYIPELAWNDDSSSSGLSSGGGGTSTLTTRPTWQSGVTGIPSGSYRSVPDLSLTSSPDNAGYLYCSSDSTTGITGSCSNGFRDTNNSYLTVAGGTSFAAPIFAGMLAILNQKVQSTGLGVVNTELYSLAAVSSNYNKAFHDITSGSNACTAGSQYCTSAGTSGYAASTGYDRATGLGSIDFYNLLSLWPASTSSSLIASSTSVTPATSQVASGVGDSITIKVASLSSSSSSVPTGTVTVSVDGSASTSSLKLLNGSTTLAFSSTTSGSHTVVASYSGDSAFSASTGSTVLTVGSSGSSGTGSFSIAATNISLSSGSSGSSTVTVTPKASYTGTVNWTVSSASTLSNACYTISSVNVTNSTPVTTLLTIYTSASACSGANSQGSKGLRKVAMGSLSDPAKSISVASLFGIFSLFGLSLFGARKRRSKASLVLAAVPLAFLLGSVGGCGSGSTSSTSSNAAKGSYSLTLTGTDASNSTISASTTLSLTVN